MARPRKQPQPTPPTQPVAGNTVCLTAQQLRKMYKDMDVIITQAVEALRQKLKTAQGAGHRRGFFDVMKNWWGNLYHGYKNPKNPYFYQNTLGYLGRPVKEMTLSQYNFLREKSEELEQIFILTEGRLQLDIELDNWLNGLKNVLKTYFVQSIENASSSVPVTGSNTADIDDSPIPLYEPPPPAAEKGKKNKPIPPVVTPTPVGDTGDEEIVGATKESRMPKRQKGPNLTEELFYVMDFKGMTLYEKTLHCIDKLKSNS